MKKSSLLLLSTVLMTTACGGSSSKKYDDAAPIVNAGNDQLVAFKDVIELSGTASDKNNDIASTTWTQVSGPIDVSLSATNTLTPLFEIPLENGLYVFELTATDKKGNTTSDRVNIEVDNYIGIWRTTELGTLVAFNEETVSTYQYTAASNTGLTQGYCLISEETIRDDVEDSYHIQISSDRLALHIEDETYTRVLIDFPEACSDENLTPVLGDENYQASATVLFDIAWNNFNEYYPFFELRDIDQQGWDKVYGELSNHISDDLSEEHLYELLVELLANFEQTTINGKDVGGDGHVSILKLDHDSDEEQEYSAISEDVFSNQLIPECEEQMLSDADCEAFMEQEIESYYSTIMGYLDEDSVTVLYGSEEESVTAFGVVSGHPIGYVMFQSMADVIPEDSSEDINYIDAIKTTMDEIVSAANESQLSAMIIDLRFNGGGYDDVTELIASYFLNTPTDVATIEKRTSGDSIDNVTLSEPHLITLAPNEGERFEGKLAVLTSRSTGSAAEVLAGFLSTKSETVNIGEPTRGNFSAELWRVLPNGWYFSLSGEVMKLADDKGNFTNYEGVGFPVTTGMEVEVFSQPDRENSLDSSIEKAIEHLSQ